VAEEAEEIHSTRLKEKFMTAVPVLTAHAKGRKVLLAFDEDKGPLISDATMPMRCVKHALLK